MSEDYVRSETFDAVMREMRALQAASEARMERSVMEMRAGNETFKAEVRQELSDMRSEMSDMKRLISAINERIETSFRFFGWGMSIVGLIIAGLQVYLAFK